MGNFAIGGLFLDFVGLFFSVLELIWLVNRLCFRKTAGFVGDEELWPAGTENQFYQNVINLKNFAAETNLPPQIRSCLSACRLSGYACS